jgi:hypothetical protein
MSIPIHPHLLTECSGFSLDDLLASEVKLAAALSNTIQHPLFLAELMKSVREFRDVTLLFKRAQQVLPAETFPSGVQVLLQESLSYGGYYSSPPNLFLAGMGAISIDDGLTASIKASKLRHHPDKGGDRAKFEVIQDFAQALQTWDVQKYFVYMPVVVEFSLKDAEEWGNFGQSYYDENKLVLHPQITQLQRKNETGTQRLRELQAETKQLQSEMDRMEQASQAVCLRLADEERIIKGLQRRICTQKRQLHDKEDNAQQIKKQKIQTDLDFKYYKKDHSSILASIAPSSKVYKRMEAIEQMKPASKIRAIANDIRKCASVLEEFRVGKSIYYNVTKLYKKITTKNSVSEWCKAGVVAGHIHRVCDMVGSQYQISVQDKKTVHARTCLAKKVGFYLALYDSAMSRAKGRRLVFPFMNVAFQLTSDDKTAFERAVHVVCSSTTKSSENK